MNRTRWISVAGLFVLGGCAVIASNDEYSMYRAYRYERNADRRTAIGAEYASRYPHGQFVTEVGGDVGRREDEFWEERRSTLEGLQAYLHAFPAGSHAAEARARMGVYDQERRRIEEQRAAAEQAERERLAAQRRSENERQRLFARNTMLFWLRLLGSLNGWGQQLQQVAELNSDFNEAFGGQPAPVCRTGRCRKSFHSDYTVPVPGRTAVEHAMDLSLDLFSRNRQLVQAGLVMHHRGLSFWFECETQGLCDPSDPDARQRSVHWAMDQLKGIVATAFPDARETPAELVGPEPEMEGAEEDPAEAAARAAQPPPPIPPQPLGVQWSYVIGCGNHGGAQITVPDDAMPQGWAQAAGSNLPVHACIRIDAYSAPDIEGVNTDEGLRISYIPATALAGGAPAHPPRPGPRRGH
jgi:hypothetical protein